MCLGLGSKSEQEAYPVWAFVLSGIEHNKEFLAAVFECSLTHLCLEFPWKGETVKLNA